MNLPAAPEAAALAEPGREILIVGAGFSGVALATFLLRQARQPLRVRLVERLPQVGRGLAYGTTDPAHLLNVPAGRMGLHPGDEGGFARFLSDRGLTWRTSDFVPRALYGDYLQAELAAAAAAAGPGVRLEVIAGEVVAVHDDAVELADGRRLHARQGVLATGGWPAAWPATLAAALGAGPLPQRWIADPWQPRALAGIAADASVLLLGTGLSALDMLMSLQGQGHRGPVTLVSRRGLLPQAHRGLGAMPAGPAVDLEELMRLRSARGLLRAVRSAVQAAAVAGHDWRELITALREATPLLWQALPAAEQTRFLRHLQPFWDTHRHRAAPPVRALADAGLQAGRLRLVAGRVLQAQLAADGATRLHLRLRGSAEVQEVQADWVVNCTGAGPVPVAADCTDRLWHSLVQQGRVQPDVHRLGLAVGARHRMLLADGQPSLRWHYIGPLLRAQHWEATAVPELRLHAQALASELLAQP